MVAAHKGDYTFAEGRACAEACGGQAECRWEPSQRGASCSRGGGLAKTDKLEAEVGAAGGFEGPPMQFQTSCNQTDNDLLRVRRSA